MSAGRKPLPKPCYLDQCEYLGFVHGGRRWRDQGVPRLYTWDGLHGEIEMFNMRGEHVGVLDAETGQLIGGPIQGRTIDV